MILPSFVLPVLVNQKNSTIGLDSIEKCLDKNHYNSYPYEINYQFNSRGFRDSEWPDSITDLKDAIWCFGDSFTLGLGSPINHTWPFILQSITGRKCINISMNGASNEWICRRAIEVIETIAPRDIVIHWSFLWRGESDDASKEDVDRKIYVKYLDNMEMVTNFINQVACVVNEAVATNVVFSTVPDFSPVRLDEIKNKWSKFRGSSWPQTLPMTQQEFDDISEDVKNEFAKLDLLKDLELLVKLYDTISNSANWVPEFSNIDFARDGYHYDKLTSSYFASQIKNCL
jgi:hypothetical protein